MLKTHSHSFSALLMNQKDIRTLKIFQAIEENDQLSQRDIAKKINSSLGLVNAFIKRLVKKGYIKLKNINPNTLKYILTYEGFTEKTRLTLGYIQYSLQYYKEAKNAFYKMGKELAEQNYKRIALYGAGELAEIAYLALLETDTQIIAIIDEKKVGQKFLNYTVKSVSYLNDISFDKIIYTSMEAEDMQAVEPFKDKVVHLE